MVSERRDFVFETGVVLQLIGLSIAMKNSHRNQPKLQPNDFNQRPNEFDFSKYKD